MGKGIGTGAAGLLLAAGLLALTACSPASTVVTTSAGASARPAPPPPPRDDASSFQGAVVSVDPAAGEVVVDVHVVWTPVVKPGTGSRRVLVDSGTAWDPPGGKLTLLPAGLEVQVKAVPVDDDGWRALQIQLVDVE